MICTTPRSGSNYLGQIFESTGVLGRPREYFNGPARRVLDDPAYPDDVDAQVERVLKDGATPNGVYALKLFPDQFSQVSPRVRLVERLPNLHFVRLRRGDVLGQAISWARALQTEQYRSTQTAKGAAAYDARLVIQRIVEIARFEAAWDIYFARLPVRPLEFTYEAVVADPAAPRHRQPDPHAVGKFQGALSSHAGRRTRRGRAEGAGRAHQDRPERDRRRDLRAGLPNGEAPCIGALVGAAADLPDQRAGLSARPALRLRPAGRHRCRDDGADRRGRRGHRRRRREHEQRRVLHDRHAQGRARRRVTLHDRLSRGRVMSQPIERFGVISGMIETAENLAKDYQITREACDEYAARSHQRAAAAWAEASSPTSWCRSRAAEEGRSGHLRQDEGCPRRCHAGIARRCEAIEKGGVVTAGNASQQNDAAAACLVVAEDKLEELGLEPMAGSFGWAAAGCEPSRMGIGPVPAVERCSRAPALAGRTSTWSSSTRPSRRRCWPC
jgi:acetyl-CoA C-acetyltransferase